MFLWIQWIHWRMYKRVVNFFVLSYFIDLVSTLSYCIVGYSIIKIITPGLASECEYPAMAWLHIGWHGPYTFTIHVQCKHTFRQWSLYTSDPLRLVSVRASYHCNTTSSPLVVITAATLHDRIMLRFPIWLLTGISFMSHGCSLTAIKSLILQIYWHLEHRIFSFDYWFQMMNYCWINPYATPITR